jgi:hypothetical protein
MFAPSPREQILFVASQHGEPLDFPQMEREIAAEYA